MSFPLLFVMTPEKCAPPKQFPITRCSYCWDSARMQLCTLFPESRCGWNFKRPLEAYSLFWSSQGFALQRLIGLSWGTWCLLVFTGITRHWAKYRFSDWKVVPKAFVQIVLGRSGPILYLFFRAQGSLQQKKKIKARINRKTRSPHQRKKKRHNRPTPC